KKPSFVGILVGSVAGLATITPAAGFVEPWAAAVIGLLAGLICYWAVQMRIKLDWDDALDVWGCHGVGGVLGSILVGVFAVGSVNGVSGLIEGSAHQLLVQTAGVLIAAAYAFIVTMLILKVTNIFTPVRVTETEEKEGLDVSIHQEIAYR
ncbi:MAG: ammonium transporter, partial [Bacillota bacterium]